MWKNFDVTAIRNFATGQGVPLDEFDLVMEKLINGGFGDFKVSCLTCGVPYPLKALEHTCKEETIALAKYVRLGKKEELTERLLNKLKELYPAKGDSVLYRGLNFLTPEAYDSFMEKIEFTGYVSAEISSWSESKEVATSFAQFVKGHNKSVREAELSKMITEQSEITGFAGILLKMNATESSILCDLRGSGFGNMKEDEVLVLAGSYPVEIEGIWFRKNGKQKYNEDEISYIHSTLIE